MSHILTADYLGKYSLLCTFSNGESKIVDLTNGKNVTLQKFNHCVIYPGYLYPVIF